MTWPLTIFPPVHPACITALVVAAHCAAPPVSLGAKQVLDSQAEPSLQALPASLYCWLQLGLPPLVKRRHSPPSARHFASGVSWGVSFGGGVVLHAVKRTVTVNNSVLIKKLKFMFHLLVVCSLEFLACLLYTSPSPRDRTRSRMPSSA